MESIVDIFARGQRRFHTSNVAIAGRKDYIVR